MEMETPVRGKILKAQASLEQLIIIGVALVFVSISFYIAASYSADVLRISQTQDAVDRLAAAADYVYSLGPNTKEYVTVYMSPDIISINVTGKRIIFTVGTSAGVTDVVASTKGDVIGSLPTYRGRQKILVQYLPTGKISIGEAGLSCAPYLISRTLNSSSEESDVVEVSNNAEINVTGISANISGSSVQFATITQQPSPELATGASTNLIISYNVSGQQASGIYSGVVYVSSENDGSCLTQLSIQINGVVSCSAICASQGYVNGTCRSSSGECLLNNEDPVPGNNYACDISTPNCCCGPSTDWQGPLVTNISHSPWNATSSNPVTINATCDDSSTGGSFIRSAVMQLDGGVWSNMSATDGAFSDSVAENVYKNVSTLGTGMHVAAVRCADTAGNSGPISYYYFVIGSDELLGPIITSMVHTEFPTTLTNLTETLIATDVYTGNNNVQNCKINLDGGQWFDAIPLDGTYDSPTETAYYNFGQLSAGFHSVYAYCTDSVGNPGGVYNDTFGVTTVDLMLVLDRSGSMSDPVTNNKDTNQVTTSSSSFVLKKSLTASHTNGDSVNITTEIRGSSSSCVVEFEARVGSEVVSSGSATGSWWWQYRSTYNVDFSGYSEPVTVDLYLRRTAASSCTAYARTFKITQSPTKMQSSKDASKTFVDVTSNSTLAGVASYSTSATTDRTLIMMDSAANRNTVKAVIDALVAGGNTCIQCGLNNGVNELISTRGRYPNTTRAIALLTDGQSNVGDTVAGAVYARDNNVIVYTIGFGDDVDETELLNIALLTHGQYYYAPDAATLLYIFQHIGQ